MHHQHTSVFRRAAIRRSGQLATCRCCGRQVSWWSRDLIAGTCPKCGVDAVRRENRVLSLTLWYTVSPLAGGMVGLAGSIAVVVVATVVLWVFAWGIMFCGCFFPPAAFVSGPLVDWLWNSGPTVAGWCLAGGTGVGILLGFLVAAWAHLRSRARGEQGLRSTRDEGDDRRSI